MTLPLSGNISLVEIASEYNDAPPHQLTEFTSAVGQGENLTIATFRGKSAARFEEFQKMIISDSVAGSNIGNAPCAMNKNGAYAIIAYPIDSTMGFNAGAVYVLRRKTDGTYLEHQKLFSPDPNVNDYFGQQGAAISGNGNFIAIPCVGADHAGMNAVGAVYVFKRIDGQFTFFQKLIASDANTAAFFFAGDLVGISNDGEIIVAGAASYDVPATNVGAAYIFKMNAAGTQYDEIQKLQPTELVAGDSFSKGGCTISGDASTIAIATPANNGYTGRMFIFNRSGDTWLQTQIVYPNENPATKDYFGLQGAALSYDGSIMVVGASKYQSYKGVVYSYKKNASGIFEFVQRIINPDDVVSVGFAANYLGLSNDATTLMVAAHAYSSAKGAVYVFRGYDGLFSFDKRLMAAVPNDGAQFGLHGAAISGDGLTATINAPSDDEFALNAGAVYIFKVQ